MQRSALVVTPLAGNGGRWRRRGNRRRIGLALGVQENGTAKDKQQGEECQLPARDLPLATISVIPGKNEWMGRPMSSARPVRLWICTGQLRSVLT
jgi:hypothetical protein